jgi:hypothetical protein
LDRFIVTTENPATTNFGQWNIILSAATLSFPSTFAPTLNQLQNSLWSWCIQASNWIEVI